MANQVIGVGSSANDGTGDNLRAGLIKVNANFVEVYNIPYSIDFYGPQAYSDDDILFRHTVKEDSGTLTFYDDDSQASPLPDPGTKPSFTVEVADSSVERIFSIEKNGTPVGTATFAIAATTGVADFTEFSGYFELDLDDILRVVCPADIGSELAGLSVTMLGFRSF